MKKSTLLTTFKVSALSLAIVGLTGCLGSGSSSSKSTVGSGSSTVSGAQVVSEVEWEDEIDSARAENAGKNIDSINVFIHPDARLISEGSDVSFDSGYSKIELIGGEDSGLLDLTTEIGGSTLKVRLVQQGESLTFVSGDGKWEIELFEDDLEVDGRPFSFDYTVLGQWNYVETGDRSNDSNSDFTLAYFASGVETTSEQLQALGDQTISYVGIYDGLVVRNGTPEGIFSEGTVGSADMTANLGSGSVSLTLKDMQALSNQTVTFNGQIIEATNAFAGDRDAGTGSFSGRFFGPEANEAGGTWNLTDGDDKYIGAFGVEKN